MSIKLSTKDKKKVLVILGPTASGKTSLAVYLANLYNGEIVSADSRQVYKGMDIGSGKDLKEYKVKGKEVPYHLIDVVRPKTSFNLATYQKKAILAIEDILKRSKLPILVGGSGLYLQAVVDNYKLNKVKPDKKKRKEHELLNCKELYNLILEKKESFALKINNSDKQNKRRLIRYLEIVEEGESSFKKGEDLYDFVIIGLSVDKDILRKKIIKRLKERLENEDMVSEVLSLKKSGLSWKKLKSFGLEYKYISQYLLKEIDYSTMENKLATAICQFAKKQNSWFRRWERQGRKIHWLNNKTAAKKLLKKYL